MKILEKVRYLEANHFDDWYETRKLVDDELSQKQPMFCLCGRLATGMHEKYCKRFNNKVNSETVKRLKHLFDKTSELQIGDKVMHDFSKTVGEITGKRMLKPYRYRVLWEGEDLREDWYKREVLLRTRG